MKIRGKSVIDSHACLYTKDYFNGVDSSRFTGEFKVARGYNPKDACPKGRSRISPLSSKFTL